MSKRVLVTGGAGFIGSAVVNLLQQKGFTVAVADNLSFGKRDFIRVPNELFFELDILDAPRLHEAVHSFSPQWVIHLAAVHFIPYCNAHPFESSNINIAGTINLLHALETLPAFEQLFFASTAAVYPISDEAVNEQTPVGPMDIYGLSKLAGEKICENFFGKTGKKTTVCRFFNAFGPNETNPHLIPEIQAQVNKGQRTIKLGNLTPKRDFIHTFDMAQAVYSLLMLEKNAFEIVNLGRGIEYSVTEIVAAFERQLGEKITIETDPARVRKVERMHLLADVSRLKKLTGWEPVWDIDEGIKTLVSVPAQK